MARFGTCMIHRAGATLHLLRPRGRSRHEVPRGSTYAYVRRHDRPLHHRAGAPLSRGDRRAVGHPLRCGARGEDDREQGSQRRSRRHPRLQRIAERAGRGPGQARCALERDHHQGDGPRRAPVRDGIGRGARHHPDPRRLQVRQVRTALRSARRLVEHRRQRPGRHDLLRAAQDIGWHSRRDVRSSAAGTSAGSGRLRDLRLEHDARVHHGAGRARLHARSFDRRVSPLASEHPDSRLPAATSP